MSSKNGEPRYDNVEIRNAADGTTVKGHDAVKKHLQGELNMQAKHGASIFFQVYRLSLQADTLKELQGDKLAEIKVDGSFASESDTVAAVKEKVRTLLKEKAGKGDLGQEPAALTIDAADDLTLILSGRPLLENTAFFEDNYILLPVWIQVLLHRCPSEEAVELINKLQPRR
jgi:hypothetical protein